MLYPTIPEVAVVGTGVIGRSWIHVFARAGCRVRAYDASPDQVAAALRWLEADLESLVAEGRMEPAAAAAVRARVSPAGSLAAAVDGAGYVQENGPERVDLKHLMYVELDRVAAPSTILGSSTSAIAMTDIARGLPGAGRCVVCHPINPPHVVPLVEILGGEATTTDTVDRAVAFHASVGQSPVRLRRFVPGFIANRMQAALIREAVDLVATGVADVEAVDATIRDGLGLRWAFMGPFAVANTNADGGVGEYFTRYRAALHGLWDALNTETRFDDDLVAELDRQTTAMLGSDRAAQRAWRDRLILAIRDLRNTLPFGSAPDGHRPAAGAPAEHQNAGRPRAKGRMP